MYVDRLLPSPHLQTITQRRRSNLGWWPAPHCANTSCVKVAGATLLCAHRPRATHMPTARCMGMRWPRHAHQACVQRPLTPPACGLSEAVWSREASGRRWSPPILLETTPPFVGCRPSVQRRAPVRPSRPLAPRWLKMWTASTRASPHAIPGCRPGR